MTPNLPLLRKILDHIDAHPEEWEQEVWMVKTPCGTAHCIAGHAAVLSGGEFVDCATVALDGEEHHVRHLAQDLLGLDSEAAHFLFHANNTREDVQRIAEQIAASVGERL